MLFNQVPDAWEDLGTLTQATECKAEKGQRSVDSCWGACEDTAGNTNTPAPVHGSSTGGDLTGRQPGAWDGPCGIAHTTWLEATVMGAAPEGTIQKRSRAS